MHLRTCLTTTLLSISACGGEPAPAPVAPAPAPSPVASVAPQPEPSAAATASAVDAGRAAPPGPAQLTFKPVALPGASAPASLDYIAFEPGRSRVWVPVGGTGSVEVYDIAAGSFTSVGGLKKEEREVRGKKRMMGPSAVSIGDGFAYVGDRGSSEVCPVDTATLKLGKCLKLKQATDGVAYVAPTREVWVTTHDQAIVVLDASKPGALKVKATVKMDGAPEGYASDASRGLFFTNLEDKKKTVVIDVKTHAARATWSIDCGDAGPRGLAADQARGYVYVACTDKILVLDGAHDGAKIASFDTGPGVDNIDWHEAQRLLYVAASKAAKVTVARIDDQGQPTIVATGASTDGARNGVADAAGNLYVADPVNARILVFANAP